MPLDKQFSVLKSCGHSGQLNVAILGVKSGFFVWSLL